MILVVAAVIVDRIQTPTRVLAARRRSPAELAGRWEFPGGKVEPGEDPVAALRRELFEELGLGVHVGPELDHPSGAAWPISGRYEMRVWLAGIEGEVPESGQDHDELRWLTRAALDDVDWLPADLAVVERLRPLLSSAGRDR